MNKKFVSGMLLLIFSTGTINLSASLPKKIASIKQKLKNSIQKVTLKDVQTSLKNKYAASIQRIKNSIKKVTLKYSIDYSFKAAIVVIGVLLMAERQSRKKKIDLLYKQINERLQLIRKVVNNHGNKIIDQGQRVDSLAVLQHAVATQVFGLNES